MPVRTCLRALAALLVSVVLLLPGLTATAQPAPAAPASAPTASAPPVPAPAPAPAAVAGTPATASSGAGGATTTAYVVQPGDTLTGIARTTGAAGGWPALYAANRDLLGPSPDLLRPGTEIVVPSSAAQPSGQPATYAVVRGDSLRAVAARLGVDGGWPALYAANRAAVGPDPDQLAIGTVLQVPSPSAAAAPGAPAASGSSDAPGGGVGTRLGETPAAPPTAPDGPSTAPTPDPSAAADPPSTDSSGVEPTSAVPAWVTWPLVLVGVLAALALVLDPAQALVRRRAAVRATSRSREDARRVAGAAAAAASALSLVRPVSELPPPVEVTGDDDGPAVHVAQHPTLLVSYSPSDDLVLVLLPPQHRLDDVLQVARVALTERAYRAVERTLPTPLRPPAGGPLAARWAG